MGEGKCPLSLVYRSVAGHCLLPHPPLAHTTRTHTKHISHRSALNLKSITAYDWCMKKGISFKMKQPQVLAVTLVEEGNDTSIPDEQVKEFLYCISKRFTLKHACSMSGIAYQTMLDWLNPNNPRHKAGLLKLFERAQALAFSHHLDAINKSATGRLMLSGWNNNEKGYPPKDPNPLPLSIISVSLPPPPSASS